MLFCKKILVSACHSFVCLIVRSQYSCSDKLVKRCWYAISLSIRDTGTGMHAPPLFETGGNGGTVALTQQYHSNVMIYQDRLETNLLQLFAHT